MKKRVFVAGHRGMVGSAICRRFVGSMRVELLTEGRDKLDLQDSAAVLDYLRVTAPEEVYLCAARVGGIHANNQYPAEFIHENLVIQTNVIDGAYRAGVNKLLFLGSSCIYPKFARQPMAETELLTGTLEPTNEPYAVAKIAGIKLCESYNRQYDCDFRSVMPTNLYGPGDNFDLETSHVIPALIRKFHQACDTQSEFVSIWGSGKPKREFLHVDDMASACQHVMEMSTVDYKAATSAQNSLINVGTGQDCSIAELAELIAEITGFSGSIKYDSSMPDGTPRKLLDVSRLHKSGWHHRIDLRQGLVDTCKWYDRELRTLS